MSDPLFRGLRRGADLTAFLGVATLVVGLLACLAPLATGLAVTVVVGVLLFFAGVSQAFFAWKATDVGHVLLRFLFAALALVVGGLMVLDPGEGVLALTLLLGIWFLVDGAFTLLLGLQLRPRRGSGWYMLSGALSLLLSLLIWLDWPVSGSWAVGLLVGIRLILAGASMLAVGSAGGALADRLAHEATDESVDFPGRRA